MNLIEPSLSQRLTAELFDRTIVPLAEARRTRDKSTYRPTDREEHPPSYFSPLSNPPMKEAAASEFPVYSTPEHLVDGLAAFWEASGDANLCCLIPMMRKIASAIQDEAVGNDGSVSVFCYAMF
jgi:hypothetical protein